jgi:mannose-6-phosphate isomerase-like protein (cupin superfamily)
MTELPARLQETPAHLGRGGDARPLPPFDGTGEWYARYEADTAADGADGRLVSWHSFDRSWDSWEMHPAGDEVVVCVDGDLDLVQEIGGEHVTTHLSKGQWVLNPPGVWHTALMAEGATATCLFITAGMGTQNRPA